MAEADVALVAGLADDSRYSASRHLQTLRAGGLVTSRKVGNRIMVRLVDERLRLIDDWVGSVVDALSDAKPTPPG